MARASMARSPSRRRRARVAMSGVEATIRDSPNARRPEAGKKESPSKRRGFLHHTTNGYVPLTKRRTASSPSSPSSRQSRWSRTPEPGCSSPSGCRRRYRRPPRSARRPAAGSPRRGPLDAGIVITHFVTHEVRIIAEVTHRGLLLVNLLCCPRKRPVPALRSLSDMRLLSMTYAVGNGPSWRGQRPAGRLGGGEQPT